MRKRYQFGSLLTTICGLVWLIALTQVLEGCAAVNPIAAAETLEQRAYAAERTYNVILGQALTAATNNAALRPAIQQIEARSTPVIEALSDAVTDYTVARAQFEAGQSSAERLTIVANNLNQWILSAQQAIIELSAAFNRD